MPDMKLTANLVAAGVGAADGYLAHQDTTWAWRQPAGSTIPAKNRSNDQTKQWSTYFELGALGLGFWQNRRARTAQQEDIASALMFMGAGLIGRRGGDYFAKQQSASATGGGTGAIPTVAAPAVFGPHRMGAPQYDTAVGRAHARTITSSLI